jgi:hypothetical protein
MEDWLIHNPNGLAKEFEIFWKGLGKNDKQVMYCPRNCANCFTNKGVELGSTQRKRIEAGKG